MKRIYKIIVTILFTTGSLALVGFLIYRFLILGGGLSPGATQLSQNTEFDKNVIQFRFSYSGEKNRNQIIHLNRGKALFKIFYKGEGYFKAELKNTNGTTLSELGKTFLKDTSSYTDFKTIDVPDENPYILTIVSDGNWDISYN